MNPAACRQAETDAAFGKKFSYDDPLGGLIQGIKISCR
jgi:hypothetical protein